MTFTIGNYCSHCGLFAIDTSTRFANDGKALKLCGSCTERYDTNCEMIALADLIGTEIKGVSKNIGGFDFTVSESVPVENIYLVPSRAAIEAALRNDPGVDLRRYFGVIKNVKS